MSRIIRIGQGIRMNVRADRPVSIVILHLCCTKPFLGAVWGPPIRENLKRSWRNSGLPLVGDTLSDLPLLFLAMRCPGNQKAIVIKKKIPVKSHLNCVTQEGKSIPTISQTLLIWKSLHPLPLTLSRYVTALV